MTSRHNTGRPAWCALLFGISISFAQPALAHKLNMFAYVENNNVFVEGYFSDGIKPKNSDVTVVAADGSVILEGKTDDEGAFVFPAPSVAPIRVVLNAGMGHQTDYTISAADLGAVATESTAATQAAVTGGGSAESAPAMVEAAGPASTVSAPNVEQAVRRAVAEAVKPLALEINTLKNKTRMSDIIGGIGLIIGLLGGFAFYKATQMKKNEK